MNSEMYAMQVYGNEVVICKAEKKDRTWMIGGDYDFSKVRLIFNVTKMCIYSFRNGRLKFQDNLTDEDVQKLRLGTWGK